MVSHARTSPFVTRTGDAARGTTTHVHEINASRAT
jgi:hypothetical protein